MLGVRIECWSRWGNPASKLEDSDGGKEKIAGKGLCFEAILVLVIQSTIL
jgi:hypothetical protein